MVVAIELLPLLQKKQRYLLIFPRDLLANEVIQWLLTEGVDFLKYMDVISFDNVNRYTDEYPTTIDFGFADLGRQAFHFISKNLPARISSKGEIRAKTTVVERGTVRRAVKLDKEESGT